MKKLILMLCVVLGVLSLEAGDINDLKLLTEDYPPYNYLDNKGVPSGIAVEILDEVLKEAGSKLTKKDFKFYPWARSYEMVKNEKNTMLFSMTVTPEREKLFKFVGPIYPTKNVLVAKKSKGIKINSLKDAEKYSIGTINGDIGETLLKDKGFPTSKIQSVAYPDLNTKKLDGDRIDMMSYGEAVAYFLIRENGFKPSDYETVYVLNEGVTGYALSKDVSDDVISKLQNALDKVKKSPRFKEIISKYTE